MANIKQLKTFLLKLPFFPKTLTKAVYDEEGNRLDQILRDTFITTDEEEYSGVIPRDADTLGGQQPSYYATSARAEHIMSSLDSRFAPILQQGGTLKNLNTKIPNDYQLHAIVFNGVTDNPSSLSWGMGWAIRYPSFYAGVLYFVWNNTSNAQFIIGD